MGFFINNPLIGNSQGEEGLNVKVDTFIATEDQTFFILNDTYTPNKNRVEVYVDQVPQFHPAFTETSPAAITLSSGVPDGTSVIIRYFL